MNDTDVRRFGPVKLAAGYTRTNALTYLYAALITVGMFAFVSFIQPYLINANLGVPRSEQGRLIGSIGFWNEVLSLLLVAPIGALADKFGRRIVYSLGFLWLAAGFFLYPLARTVPQLYACALFFAVGVSAAGCMLATVLADTPREDSRGLLVGMAGLFQGIGALLAVLVLGGVPKRLADGGMDASTAGRITLGVAAALCVVSALVCWLGLNKARPGGIERHEPLGRIMQLGFDAARGNRRIWLGYMLQFVAFGDRIVFGSFFSLRLQQSGIEAGLSPAAAASAARLPYASAATASLLLAVFFGLLLDRVDRVKGSVVAMAVAGVGYIVAGFVGDPHSPWIMPVAILLGFGQISAIVSSATVLGQEAPRDIRGAVFGVAGICASAGILFTNAVGGRLYDMVDRGGPFFLLGALALVVMGFALNLLRRQRRAAAAAGP